MKPLEKTRDLRALATDVPRLSGRAEELGANVAIAKSHDGVFATHDGGEKSHVLVGCRIESALTPAVLAEGLSKGSEGLSRLRGVLDFGQGVEIPVVGGDSHFFIAVEVRDAFGHGEPAHDEFTLSFAKTPDLEGIRSVDDGLDAQYAAMLVVHFNTVSGDPMPDPDAGQPLLVVVEDLAAKVPVEFSSEEGQDILGAEAQRRVLRQFFIQELEGSIVLEHHVGRQFRLLSNPVILVPFQNAGHQRVHFPCECGEDAGPVLLDEAVGKALGAGGFSIQKKALSHVRKPCIHPGCQACARGDKHPSWIFTLYHEGKQRCLYVPEDLVATLRQAIANGRKVEQMLAKCGAALLYEHRRGRTRRNRSRKKGQ